MISFVIYGVLTMAIAIASDVLGALTQRFDPAILDQELYHRRVQRMRPKSSRTRNLRRRYSLIFSKNYGVRRYVWHQLLRKLGLQLAFNQLVTGFGLLICTLAKYGVYSANAHAALA